MPTYEYECKTCAADFEVFQSMSDEPLKACPTCGKAVRRKISKGTGIIFKGSGFYRNDSRKPSEAKDEAPRKETAATADAQSGASAAAASSSSSSASPAPAAPPPSAAPAKKETT